MTVSEEVMQRLEAVSFPTPPAVVVRLVQLLSKDNVTAGEIADTMALDASMATRVLQLANSVALGAGSQVDSIPEAVLRVGVEGVRDIVFSLAMVGAMRPAHFDYRPFWRHSLAVAFTAQSLQSRAQHLSSPFPETYTAGLLHDIGMLVLDRALGAQYCDVLAAARTTARPLSEIEHEMLGTDHTLAGGRMLEIWHFPDLLVDAVRHHHKPWVTGHVVTRLVHLADFICNRQGIHHGSGHFPQSCAARIWDELGIDESELPGIVASVQTDLARAEAVLATA
jgi:HD-like signal output (HDOD) protein